MAIRIQLRRDTAANWISSNPTLRAGEIGIETDTLKFKIGNGSSTWTAITAYANITPSGLSSSLGDYILQSAQGTPTGPAELNSDGDLIIPENSIILWNDTAHTYSTTLTATQPTADRTITFPNVTGTVALTANIPSTTDTLTEGSTNKYFSDELAQDAVAAALAAGTHTNISVAYNDAGNAISLTGAVTYSDENAQDAIGNALGTGLSYNDTTGAVSVDTSTIQARVTNVTDTEIGYLDGVTSAIQTQMDTKLASATAATTYAPLASPTFTGTATLAGTGDFIVNGTSNIRIAPAAGSNAYIGTAVSDNIITTAASLNLKAPLASPTFTGTPTLPSATIATTQTAGDNSTAVATTAFVGTAVANLVDSSPALLNTLDEIAAAIGDDPNFAATLSTSIGLKAPLASPTFTGTVSGITSTMVGLGNVDNTTDANKPVSTATQTALDLKASLISPTFTTPTLGAATATSINTLTVGLGAGSISTNTVVGSTALITNTTGAQNIAIGKDALKLNTTGSDNAAIGYQALDANTTGASNVAYGSYTLGSNTTGGLNTGIGDSALASNTTGTHNTGIGSNALVFSTTGLKNTGVGSYALRSNTTGSQNTALGQYALFANTTVSDNTAIGFEALRYNTTGTPNTAVGSYALNANTTGSDNTAVGQEALKANTIGGQNTAIGSQSGEFTTTGNGNTSIGAYAFQSNTTGGYNTTVGYGSLGYNTTGIDNVAVGVGALDANTNGSYNTAIGRTAGGLTTGSNNIVIGNTAQALSSTTSNSITLGNSSITTFRIPGLSISATTTALTVPSLTPTNAIGAIYGGTGLSTYTTGDILYSSASNTLAKLAAGTDGYILTLAAGIPSWAAAPITLPSQTGNSGYYLTTNGTSASWGALVVPITTGTATVSANTATTVDTTALSAFTSIEYMVSLKQGSKVRTSKVVVQTDGTSVDMTEFAITETGGTIAGVVISAAVVSTDGVLQLTVTDAATTNVTVKFSKVSL